MLDDILLTLFSILFQIANEDEIVTTDSTPNIHGLFPEWYITKKFLPISIVAISTVTRFLQE